MQNAPVLWATAASPFCADGGTDISLKEFNRQEAKQEGARHCSGWLSSRVVLFLKITFVN
jgi:hypothetical protein